MGDAGLSALKKRVIIIVYYKTFEDVECGLSFFSAGFCVLPFWILRSYRLLFNLEVTMSLILIIELILRCFSFVFCQVLLMVYCFYRPGSACFPWMPVFLFVFCQVLPSLFLFLFSVRCF